MSPPIAAARGEVVHLAQIDARPSLSEQMLEPRDANRDRDHDRSISGVRGVLTGGPNRAVQAMSVVVARCVGDTPATGRPAIDGHPASTLVVKLPQRRRATDETQCQQRQASASDECAPRGLGVAHALPRAPGRWGGGKPSLPHRTYGLPLQSFIPRMEPSGCPPVACATEASYPFASRSRNLPGFHKATTRPAASGRPKRRRRP